MWRRKFMTVGFRQSLADVALRKTCQYLPDALKYFIGDTYSRSIRRRRFGGPGFRSYWRALCETERWGRAELEKLQWEKFKQLLEHASQNVEWYRRRFAETGITPDDIKGYDDLPKIPILTKDEVRRSTTELIADGIDEKDLIVRGTGGSTGVPLRVLWDERCYIATRAATVRWLKYAGADEIADRRVWVKRGTYRRGSDGSDFFGQYYPTENEMMLSSTNMTPSVLREYVRKLRSFRPKAILGYSSAIYMLATYVYENGIDDVHIDVAQTSADTLWPKYRKIIETAFGGKVFDVYGLAERVCSASECERHEGMHIDMEMCLVETIDEDGRHVFDEEGEIIGTNLENYAMPLIRYRVNDLGKLSSRTCPCGRESVLLDGLVGRTTDMVTTPDGRKFRLVFVYDIGLSVPGVREFQFVQPSTDLLTVNMVKREGVECVDTTTFLEMVRSLLGNEIRIEINFVDSIPTTRGGKKKLVVSHVAPHPV